MLASGGAAPAFALTAGSGELLGEFRPLPIGEFRRDADRTNQRLVRWRCTRVGGAAGSAEAIDLKKCDSRHPSPAERGGPARVPPCSLVSLASPLELCASPRRQPVLRELSRSPKPTRADRPDGSGSLELRRMEVGGFDSPSLTC